MNMVIGGGTLALFGTSIISQVAAGTLNILYNTLGFITYGNTSNSNIKNIKSTLNTFDLDVNIKLAQEFLLKTDKTDNEKIIEKGLNDVINKINIQLEIINNTITSHQSKWFASYRNFDVSSNILELKELSTILNHRLELLILLTTNKSII